MRGVRLEFNCGGIVAAAKAVEPHGDPSCGRARARGGQRTLPRSRTRRNSNFHRHSFFSYTGLGNFGRETRLAAPGSGSFETYLLRTDSASFSSCDLAAWKWGARSLSGARGAGSRDFEILDVRAGAEPPPDRYVLARRTTFGTNPCGSRRFRPR